MFGKNLGGLIVALGLLLICAPVGQCNISVVPQLQQISLLPGQTRTWNFGVSSAAKVPLNCHVTVWNMKLNPDGMPIKAEPDDPHGCADWLTVDPTSMTLEPDGGAAVTCILRAPREASGGYFAMFQATGRSGEDYWREEGATIRFGFGAVAALFVTVRGPQTDVAVEIKQQQIGLFEQEGEVRAGRQWRAQALVENTGNMHSTMVGEATILTADARTILETVSMVAGLGWVLPGSPRLFRARGQGQLPDGAYLLRTRVGPQYAAISTWARKLGPFFIKDSQVQPGEPTEEMKAALDAIATRVVVIPGALEYEMLPGATRTEAIELRNISPNQVQIQAETVDWQVSERGRMEYGEDLHHPRSAAHWIQRLRRVNISGRGSTRVTVPIHVPRKAAAGEYYAGVVFRAVIDGRPQPIPTSELPVVLMTVRVEGEAAPKVVVTNCSVTPEDSGGLYCEFTAANEGNTQTKIRPLITIFTSGGRKVGESLKWEDRPPATLLAGGSRTIGLHWLRILQPGHYQARFSVISDEGEVVPQTADFEIAEPEAGKNGDSDTTKSPQT